MLRELLYEMLCGATNFVKIVFGMEDFIDPRKNVFMRFIVKVSEIMAWILCQLVLISMTGGLYLIWIGIKIAWKASKRERRNRKLRRR